MPRFRSHFAVRAAMGILLVTMSGLLAGPSPAEELTDRWGLGLEFGFMKLTEGYWDYSNVDQFGGFNVEYGLSSKWNLQGSLKYGYVRPGVTSKTQDAGFTFDSGAALYTTILQPELRFHYRFAPDAKACPWIGAGGGMTKWKVLNKYGEDVGLFPSGDPVTGYDQNGDQVPLEGTDLTLTVELGLDIFLTQSLALNLGGRYHMMPGNDVDNIGMSYIWNSWEYVDANKGLAEGFLGLTWWFGSSDRDGDGIPNDRDLCPNDPEDLDGFQDDDGCPDPDNDGDRLPDAQDACPDQPEDLDGFQDDDGCPDPDNDGDGLLDGDDNCPDEAEDIDGFMDDDGCPDPDNDGDGVLDSLDNCPDTPAGIEVDESGCPIIEEIKESLVLEGVTFLSGSAQLTPESVGILAKVAESLRAWPNVRIEVRGHTDSVGPGEANRNLSYRRALTVRDSLIQMGISASRISAVGFGEDYPIADNDSREGRATNRRVEIHRVN